VLIVNDISVVDSMDSTAQTGQTSGGDWQEEVYQKVICYFLIFISWVNWVEQKIVKQMAFVPKNYFIIVGTWNSHQLRKQMETNPCFLFFIWMILILHVKYMKRYGRVAAFSNGKKIFYLLCQLIQIYLHEILWFLTHSLCDSDDFNYRSKL